MLFPAQGESSQFIGDVEEVKEDTVNLDLPRIEKHVVFKDGFIFVLETANVKIRGIFQENPWKLATYEDDYIDAETGKDFKIRVYEDPDSPITLMDRLMCKTDFDEEAEWF